MGAASAPAHCLGLLPLLCSRDFTCHSAPAHCLPAACTCLLHTSYRLHFLLCYIWALIEEREEGGRLELHLPLCTILCLLTWDLPLHCWEGGWTPLSACLAWEVASCPTQSFLGGFSCLPVLTPACSSLPASAWEEEDSATALPASALEGGGPTSHACRDRTPCTAPLLSRRTFHTYLGLEHHSATPAACLTACCACTACRFWDRTAP